MTDELITGGEPLEIRWPEKLPETTDEVLAFQRENLYELKRFALQEFTEAIGNMREEDIRRRWQRGDESHPIFDLFKQDLQTQGEEEVFDFFNYVTGKVLLWHFSQ